jgi:hypothetical protein
MNKELLEKYAHEYRSRALANPDDYSQARTERSERVVWFRAWDRARLRGLNADSLEEYLSQLWAMRVWGNKRYYTDLIIAKNGIDAVRDNIAALVFGDEAVSKRWDSFRENISQIGPAMVSELLAHYYPTRFPVWNRRAKEALERLGEENLPKYDYQLSGTFYDRLIKLASNVAEALTAEGFEDVDMLVVDYFFWDLVQEAQAPIEPMHTSGQPQDAPDQCDQVFVHNEIRDKIAEIGAWLGFTTSTEQNVTTGTRIDVLWEASIGNMGRVLYVFEVQTSGSIDSLQLNLLRSLSNPAVQAVIAVSDERQLERIKAEAATLPELKDKLRYWDSREVLETHAALSTAFDSINRLKLVPDAF